MTGGLDAETNVMRWLESRLADALRLADVLAALEELDGRDGVKSIRFQGDKVRATRMKADAIGSMLADIEGRRMALEVERAEIVERLNSARAVLRRARVGASAENTAKLDYCERRYIDAMPRRDAAAAVGAGEWAAKRWPRAVASLVYSCEPERFDYAEEPEPLGYWLI